MAKSNIKSNREYSRILDNMNGVDPSGRGESKTSRYAYVENMYRDYDAEHSDLIQSVPGFRKVYQGSAINGLHLQTTTGGEKYVIINDNGVLWRYKTDSPSSIEKLKGTPNVGSGASFSFPYCGNTFVGDGDQLYGINDNGYCYPVYDNRMHKPYCPTTYVNDAEHEQINLLTTTCYEKYVLNSPSNMIRETPSLIYMVTSETRRECTVIGISDNTIDVHIPATTVIGGYKYSVTSIDVGAFYLNETIETVTVADSVQTVRGSAFYGCISLRKFFSGSGLIKIDDRAFENSALESIYIPAAISSIGQNAIPPSTVIEYELGESEYAKISGAPENAVRYRKMVEIISIGIRIHTKTKSIITVKLGGNPVSPYGLERSVDGYVEQVIISNVNINDVAGQTLEVCLLADETAYQESSYGEDFTKRVDKNGHLYTEIIRDCRKASVIGARIFTWGNPKYPSVLFYSSAYDTDCKLYFGSLNYVDLGGVGEVLSVLPFNEGIAVFARRVDGGESILFCEEQELSNSKKEKHFVITNRHRTSELSGAVATLSGEAVFLTSEGLFAIGERTLYEPYRIEPRSSLIAPLLARENLAEASLCEWCGYTVISVGGNLYLADPRRKVRIEDHYEPEWFCLRGVGTYDNDTRVYRYSSTPREGYLPSDTPDEIVREEVWSEGVEGGDIVYFVNTEDGRIEVYPTEEMTGGDFYGARLMLAFDDMLIFSTDNGAVCIFNTDMRGVPPEHVSSSPDFDAEEYARSMGNRIHPYFYDFALHSPRYALITTADDCDVPHLRKNTVRRSLILKLATFLGGRVHCEVGCDGRGFKSVGSIDSGSADISSLSFLSSTFDSGDSVSIAMPEGERGWVEKSIALHASDFRSPIGVYSIAYRYKIGGRIRNS